MMRNGSEDRCWGCSGSSIGLMVYSLSLICLVSLSIEMGHWICSFQVVFWGLVEIYWGLDFEMVAAWQLKFELLLCLKWVFGRLNSKRVWNVVLSLIDDLVSKGNLMGLSFLLIGKDTYSFSSLVQRTFANDSIPSSLWKFCILVFIICYFWEETIHLCGVCYK